MRSKKGAIECHICGAPKTDSMQLSYTGQCPTCSLWGAIENLKGLMDKGSVWYKTWQAAYELSKPGKPPFTTPPTSWNCRASIYVRKNALL